MEAPRLKKAILRPLHKVRMDVDREGTITPVRLRLEPEGEPIVITSVDHVDDRITEVWFEVETQGGDRLVLRVERERLRWDLQTVESSDPDRYRGWLQVEREAAPAAADEARVADDPACDPERDPERARRDR